MNISIVEYEGDQLEIDFAEIDLNLDRPQLSICPKCSGDIIKLADGCHICGWSENQSRSVESSVSIPCTVKQPNQPERSGVIKQDLGSRFIVYIPSEDSTVTVSKLFVYPDFSKLDKCSRKNIPASKNCSRKNIPASKNSPRKNRRRKGEGSGSIHYRMVTKNGKQYQEAYYLWRENGKKRTKYISNKLLNKVLEAESRKLPVSDILVLLAGKDKSPRKSSDTLSIGDCSENSGSEKVMETSAISPRKIIPASKKRRSRGKGGGWIECKPIKRSGKEYKQYWYHYETWSDGDRLVQSSKYIPKKMEAKIIRMNNEKAPVAKILKVLETKSKRKK